MNIKTPSRKTAALIQLYCSYTGQAVAIVQGLLLVPLFIDVLGVDIYGFWLASGGVLAWLSFVDLGLGAVIIQRVADSYSKNNYELVHKYFINGLVVFIVASIFLVSLGVGLSVPVVSLINVDTENIDLLRGCFLVAVLAMAFKVLNECLRGFAVALLRPLIPEVSLVLFLIVGLVATISMLLNGFGLWSLPLGHLIAQAGVFFVNLIYSFVLLKKLEVESKKFDLNILKEYMRLSPYLIGGRVGESLVRNIEPTLIAIVLSPEVTTAYTVTRRAAELVWQLLNVVLGATYSSLVHVVAEENVEKSRQITKTILKTGFFGGLLGFGIYLATNNTFVELWVGHDQVLNRTIIVLIAVAMFHRVIQNYFVDLNMAMGNIKFASISVLTESFVRLSLMYFFLTTIGLSGVPLGAIISCVLFVIVLAIPVNKKFHLSLDGDFGRFFAYTFCALSILVTSIFLQKYYPLTDTWAGFSLQLVFSGLILFLILFLNPVFRYFFSEFSKRFVLRKPAS